MFKTKKTKIGLAALLLVLLYLSTTTLVANAASNVATGSGTWVDGLTFTWVASSDGTTANGATGEATATPDSNIMTISATASRQVTSGSGLSATTTQAQPTTITVTVKNKSGKYLKVTSLDAGDNLNVSGVSVNDTLEPNQTFTFSLTAQPSSTTPTNVTTASSTVQISVEEVQTDNIVTFYPVQNIDGASPGAYTISQGGSSVSVGTHESTIFTSYTLTASTNSGYVFDGWVVNGKVVSTNDTLTRTFINETNTVIAAFSRGDTTDPLEKIAVLNSDDPSISKYDVAEYYSYYEPGDYQLAITVDADHPKGNNYGSSSAAAKLGSYEGKSNNTDNAWPNTNLSSVDWNVSGASMLASRSSTAYGDNGINTAGSAKTNAKILQIKATQTIRVSFDYTVTETYDITKGTGDQRQLAFFYSYTSTSATPNLAQLKSGTVWGAREDSNSGNNTYSGSFEETIEAGEYLYLYFFGFGYNYRTGSNSFAYAFNSTISNVLITPETRTFDFQSGSIDGAGNMIGSGAITINNNNYTVGSNGKTNIISNLNGGQRMSLDVATIPSGYTHIGWRIMDGDTTTDVFRTSYDFNLESDITVYALFSPKIAVTAGGENGFGNATYGYKTPNGSNVTGANQYIARSSDGTSWYKSLSEAFALENTVVLATNVDLNGNFTLPQGKTLSVPYALPDAATTILQNADGSGGISNYITATINGSMTVSGDLVASARQSVNAGQNGKAFGKVGYIVVNGSVSVESTGKIYAYGLVTGGGSITVKTGGEVYELMEVRDMRTAYGLVGHATSPSDYNSILPFNSYYFNTNLVATNYQAGARLYANYFVNVSQQTSGGIVPVIGPYNNSDSSLFMIQSGSLTKGYSTSGDYANKTYFRANPGSSIQSGRFTVSITVSVGLTYTVSIDTAQKVLPIGAGYLIEIADGGAVTLNSDFKILPGGAVKIDEGGTLTISSGKKLVMYRANDYDFTPKGNEAGNGNSKRGFTVNGYPQWGSYPSFSLGYSNLGSAKLIVDGTLDCKGGLYVTDQQLTVTIDDKSSNGIITGSHTQLLEYPNGFNFLKGTGIVKMASSIADTTILEQTERTNMDNKDLSCSGRQSVAITAIKGLTNWYATDDDGQTGYNSLTQGTWYGYINEYDVNVWSTSQPVTLTYYNNSGSGDGPAAARRPAGTEITVAANTFTGPDGRDFVKWNTKPDGTGMSYNAGDQLTLTENTTLYAIWSAPTFTVTFDLNYEGATGGPEAQTVEAGGTATAPTPVPTREGYTFVYWYAGDNQDVVYTFNTPVDGDLTLKAKWQQKTYTITWKNANGDELDSQTVNHGETPEYSGNTPTKAADEQYTYTFAGWTPEVTAAKADATYTATFTESLREYTITWENIDGNGGSTTSSAAYGTTPVCPVKPAKAGNAQYSYSFIGWDREVTPVEADTTYAAQFTETTNTYTVTWKDADGNVIETDTNVPYGTPPSFDGEKPTKAPEVNEDGTQTVYALAWSPSLSNVTGDAVYQATFTPGTEYLVEFKDFDGNVVVSGYYPAGTSAGDIAQPKAEDILTTIETESTVYTFTGWSPEVTDVTEPQVYLPVYNEARRTYTVTWSINGATTEETYAYGDYPYHVQPGYYSDGGTVYNFTGWEPRIAIVTGNVTYTAQYEAVAQRTVSFQGNGGEISLTSQTILAGVATQLETGTYTYADHVFIGWNTAADGTGTMYDDGQYVVLEDSITLYAQWLSTAEATATYHVRWYDEIDGRSLGEYRNETLLSIAQPTVPSHLGKKFVGWSVYVYNSDNYEYVFTVGAEEPKSDGTTQALLEDDETAIANAKLQTLLNALLTMDQYKGVQQIDIYAHYQNASESCTITTQFIDMSTGAVLMEANSSVTVGRVLMLTADAEYNNGGESLKFNHWEYDGQNVEAGTISIRPSSSEDVIVLKVFYGDSNKELKPVVYVTDAYAETVNGVNKTAVTLAYDIPAGIDPNEVEVGFQYATSQAKIDAGTLQQYIITNDVKGSRQNWSFTLHLKVGSNINRALFVRAYLIYNGEPVYTDWTTYVWQDLELKDGVS